MKKFISLLLCITLCFSMILTVSAASELSGSRNYTVGSLQNGSILEGKPSSVYKFSIPNSGRIDINFSAEIEYVYLKLYDENGKEMWSETPAWNRTTEQISFQKSSYLCAGTYYFSASEYYGRYGEFEFTIDFTAIYESFAENQNGSDNTVKTSNNILHGHNYIGCIALNDTVDVFKFNIAQSGKLDINFSAQIERVYLKIYDKNGKEIWSDNPGWNSTTEQISYQRSFYLCKGDYYLSVSDYYGKYGEYDFTLLFTSSNESFAEPQEGINNKVNVANMIDINQEYNGLIAMNDEVDIYRINIYDPSVTLNFYANTKRMSLKIYDETGKQIWDDVPSWNSTTELITYTKEHKLAPGLYYFSVSTYYGDGIGNYTFHFTNGMNVTKAPAISAMGVTLNGKAIEFDQPPVADSGRTLVPLRAIFEALGATVNWDQETQTITSSKGSTNISLTLGNTIMYKNGQQIKLDVPPKVINSRTLVPVRAIAEAYGCNVSWDQPSQTVIITE